MRYLEVRRHSYRLPPNQNLSQEGVTLARRLGEETGHFDEVVTSPLPRCTQTAVAMGYAISQTINELAGDDGLGESFPHMESLNWKLGCGVFSEQLAFLPELTDFVSKQARIWRDIVERVSEGERALLITHGGAYLDGTAVYCLPAADHHAWGEYSDCCEGIRLSYMNDEFVSAEVLRIK